MDEIINYDDAVKTIKLAILRSQYDAAKSVNEKQLMLYFGVGRFISHNSRNGYWGRGAIDTISDHLDRELPGLRGFSARNLRNMRTFYEEWTILDVNQVQTDLAVTTAKSNDMDDEIWQLQLPKEQVFPIEEFLSIGFTHHISDSFRDT